MSINLPTHYVQQYASYIDLLLQQKGSRLNDAVMTGSHVGKQASPVDQIGKVAMQPVTSKFAPMGRVDAPTDRRWIFPNDADLPQLIDTFDKLRLLADPTSSYVQNAVYAAGRDEDDKIIAAFFGDAKTGEQGATTTTFPAGQVVAVNFGSASNVGMTVAKLREAKRLLIAAEVDIDNDPLTVGLTSGEHDDMLGEIQAVSLDYNTKPVLVDGKITAFMGFNFKLCERFATDGAGFRRNPAWARSGMYLGRWGSRVTDISQRKDLQGLPWQVYLMHTIGATRLEETKVVEIKCA